jgi:hypothetical protein
LDHASAAELLPGCDLRPPLRRGDLYRDRERGASFFLVLDGSFQQRLAVPPREVLDVLADGAVIAGASSMGALRAAECWPAGMRGIGSIYRLYRRGRLSSDDEVAVSFDPEQGTALSVPLINVRWAASRAIRAGWLTVEEGRRLVTVTERTFYPERSWRGLLQAAELEHDEHLAERLATFDLKRSDARRALLTVARWLHREPRLLCRRGADRGAFRPSEAVRERAHDASAGLDTKAVKAQLARWFLASGLYRTLLPDLDPAPSHDAQEAPSASDSLRLGLLATALGARAAATDNDTSGLDASPLEPEQLQRALARELRRSEAWPRLLEAEDSFANALWAELGVRGELDAAIFRWRAVHEAADRAGRRGLEADLEQRYLAEVEISHGHGFASWQQTLDACRGNSRGREILERYRDRLALAKAMRKRLFAPTGASDL